MRISRRDMIKLSGVSGLAALATACSPSLLPVTESLVPETVNVKPANLGKSSISSADTIPATVPAAATPAAASAPMQAAVIVVGAGMAGLAAASQLRAKGKSVIILEGRERIG